MIFVTLATFGLFGCAATPPAPDASWQSPRPLGAGIQTFVPPSEPSGKMPEGIDLSDPAGTLTLRNASALALMRNPALEGAGWEVRAGEAKALQEGLPQNPSIGIGVGGLTSSTLLSHFESTGGISQTFELGKLGKKARVAALQTDLAGWDFEIKRLDVLAETARAFIEVLYAQALLTLYEQLAQTSEQIVFMAIEGKSSKKHAPGSESTAGDLDRMKAEAHLSSAKIRSEQARVKLEAARRSLAATWGEDGAVFEKAEGTLVEITPIPPFDNLKQLTSQNPEVARWKKETEQRRALLELEKAKLIPDVTLSGGLQQYSDGTGPVFGVWFPLPVLDRNQGNILAAGYKLEKAAAESRDAALRVHTALGNAYRELVSSYKEAKTLESEILPAYERVFSTHYQVLVKKRSGIGDVLDAHQTLFETRARYLEVLAAYHRARVDVERLIGQGLESVGCEK